ncbi:MAG: B3/4 domain-containing protein [Chitinophagales bacterium]
MLPNLHISADLNKKCPNLQLAFISCKVQVEKKNELLWQTIEETEKNIKNTVLTAPAIGKLPNIAESRAAYKRLGKEPSRYRLSAEALMRRIVKGKSIYQINNVVDVINLVSMQSGYSIGGYNAEKIVGNVIFGIGKQAEPYEAIGRGSLNIEFLPVFRDKLGAFGSPTSDSLRTMISHDTQQLLMVIIDFEGKKQILEQTQQKAIKLLEKYAAAQNIVSDVVKVF